MLAETYFRALRRLADIETGERPVHPGVGFPEFPAFLDLRVQFDNIYMKGHFCRPVCYPVLKNISPSFDLCKKIPANSSVILISASFTSTFDIRNSAVRYLLFLSPLPIGAKRRSRQRRDSPLPTSSRHRQVIIRSEIDPGHTLDRPESALIAKDRDVVPVCPGIIKWHGRVQAVPEIQPGPVHHRPESA